MFDNLKLVHRFKCDRDEELWLEWFIAQGHILKEHEKGYFYTVVGHIRIKYMPDKNMLHIDNSLHKFFHGNNFNIFTYEDICKAILSLSKLVDIPLKELYLRGIEIGVNIFINHDPNDFLEKLLWFKPVRRKKQQFDRVLAQAKRNSTAIFYEAPYYEDSIKLYNKSKHEKLSGQNIIRFELRFLKMRKLLSLIKLPKKTKITLDNLAKESFLNKIVKLLNDSWNAIQLEETYDYTGMKASEIAIIYAGNNKKFWRALDHVNKNTKKDYKLNYNRLISMLPVTDMRKYYNEKFQDSLDRITNNDHPFSPHVMTVRMDDN